MTKVLITGGAGFVGSHLVEFCLEQGYQVCVIDNLSTGKKENLQKHMANIEFFERDFLCSEALEEAMQGCNYVFHLAAIVSIPLSVENPISTHNTNLTGTLNVFYLAYKLGVKRVIYASSTAVYGYSNNIPFHENMKVSPMTPYGWQKLMSEQYALYFYQRYGLETVGLRCFNIFGPRQQPDSSYAGVVSIFMNLFSKGKSAYIYGDGEQTRDFVYIDDVVDAYFLAMQIPQAEGNTFNIGLGKSVSVNQLYTLVQKISNTNYPAIYQPSRTGEIKHSLACLGKSKKVLGYYPQVSIEHGLKETWFWFCQSTSPKLKT